MKTFRKLLPFALLLPVFAFAEDWSSAQQEVLAFEEACITTDNVDDFINCFHGDFVGWGMGFSVPTTKTDRQKTAAHGFANNTSEVILFKPLTVNVQGNMAVVNYITTAKTTNNTTDEVTYATERWSDICLKDGGKWYWIADHGEDISDD